MSPCIVTGSLIIFKTWQPVPEQSQRNVGLRMPAFPEFRLIPEKCITGGKRKAPEEIYLVDNFKKQSGGSETKPACKQGCRACG
jgi:hypothetical protein